MEWHISYHPLKESEIHDSYFAVLDNPALEKEVARQYDLNDVSAQRLSEVYQAVRTSHPALFQTSHGFSLAIVAGFLRKYWYVRGSSFASVVEKDSHWERYSSLWETLVPLQYKQRRIENKISTHFSSGVYLSCAGLQRLRVDYDGNAHTWAILEDTFSHGRLAVFWQAVNYAIDHEMGILEASDVIMPDPLNPSNTRCYSDALNCEPDGIVLYQEATTRKSIPRRLESSSTVEEELYPDLAQPLWQRS